MFRGHEGIRQAWHGVREAWDVYRLDAEDARVVGENLVILGRIHARGAASGLELDSPWSAVVRFRDGKVISAWDWPDHVHALEAAGLPEEVMSRENVEAFRRAVDVFNWRDVDAFAALPDPDVVSRPRATQAIEGRCSRLQQHGGRSGGAINYFCEREL